MHPSVLWSLRSEYLEVAFIARFKNVNELQPFPAFSCLKCTEEVRKCSLLKCSLNWWQVFSEYNYRLDTHALAL